MSGLAALLHRGFERLTGDVLVGRHGDPHVAFVVLVYPDRAPEIIAVTPAGSGCTPLARIVESDDKLASKSTERFFDVADLSEASAALSDADSFMRYGRRWREDGDIRTLGQRLAEKVSKGWQRRRDVAFEQALEADAEKARRPEVCPYCRSRFTRRGFPVHLARARYCSQMHAKAQAQDAAP